MNKKIKVFVTFLAALVLCFSGAMSKAKVTHAAERMLSLLVLENGDEIEQPLNFTLTSNDGTNHVIKATSDESYVDFKKVKEDVSYTVSLEKNDIYTMDSFALTVKSGTPHRDDNDEIIYNLDVTKLTSHSENTPPTKPSLNKTSLFLAVLDGEEEVSDELNFEFKSKDETISVKSGNGEVGVKLNPDTSYTVTLLDNPKYTMDSFSFTLEEGIPYDDNTFEVITSLDLKKKEQPTSEVTPPSNTANDENTTPSAPTVKKTTLFLAVLDGKDEVSDELNFEFKSEDETIAAKNDDGQTGAKLKNDTSYTVTLLENSKYTMDSFSFTLHNGTPYRDDNNELVVSLDLKKKGENNTEITPPSNTSNNENTESEDCGCEETNQQKVTIKKMKLVDSKNPEGDTVKDKLTFVFFNVSKQKPAGEFISENGKLPEIELIADDEYEVYLKENDNYGMKHYRIYAFMNHYPINMDDPYERYIDSFELIKKDKDYIEPQRDSVKATMQVTYNNKLLKDNLTFEFISTNETLRATSENGVVTVNLKEGIDYMVGLVDSDKYDIETFPIVIKNKQVGKFPYDHRTCYLVEYLNVVDKGTISTTNPHYTIATKDEKVRISGMNFADLRLDVEKIDSSAIPALNGKTADVYDINFINIYRKEVVKLTGDFTVTLPKERGKKVVAIYYINSFGQLEKRDAIDGEFNSVITFKTDHFSRYALVYEDPSDNSSEESANTQPNENDNKQDENSSNESANSQPNENENKQDENSSNESANSQPSDNSSDEPANSQPSDNSSNEPANTQPNENDNKQDVANSDDNKSNQDEANLNTNDNKQDKNSSDKPKDDTSNANNKNDNAQYGILNNNTNDTNYKKDDTNKSNTTNPKETNKNKLPNTGSSTTNLGIIGLLALLGAVHLRKIKR